MAIAEQSESQSGGTSAVGSERRGSNRSVWIVLFVLLVLLVGGSVIAGTSTTSSQVNQGLRAVVVPTGDIARTVIVPPCGTGSPVSSGGTANVLVTGATVVELPQGSGVRLVLVPRCAAGSGASGGQSLLPSAAFVPRPNTPIPTLGGSSASGSSGPVVGDPSAATSQLAVTAGSDVHTVVVPPCTGKSTGPAESVLASAPATPGVAVAPGC
jgi:hypothetical protein